MTPITIFFVERGSGARIEANTSQSSAPHLSKCGGASWTRWHLLMIFQLTEETGQMQMLTELFYVLRFSKCKSCPIFHHSLFPGWKEKEGLNKTSHLVSECHIMCHLDPAEDLINEN